MKEGSRKCASDQLHLLCAILCPSLNISHIHNRMAMDLPTTRQQTVPSAPQLVEMSLFQSNML